MYSRHFIFTYPIYISLSSAGISILPVALAPTRSFLFRSLLWLKKKSQVGNWEPNKKMIFSWQSWVRMYLLVCCLLSSMRCVWQWKINCLHVILYGTSVKVFKPCDLSPDASCFTCFLLLFSSLLDLCMLIALPPTISKCEKHVCHPFYMTSASTDHTKSGNVDRAIAHVFLHLFVCVNCFYSCVRPHKQTSNTHTHTRSILYPTPSDTHPTYPTLSRKEEREEGVEQGGGNSFRELIFSARHVYLHFR